MKRIVIPSILTLFLAVATLAATGGQTAPRRTTPQKPRTNAPTARRVRPAIARPANASGLITNFTRADIALIVESFPPEQKQQFGDPKIRQEFLAQVKEVLAQAVEATKLGLTGTPEAKEQIALLRSLAVASEFDLDSRKGVPGPTFTFLKQEEIDAFLRQPDAGAKFDHFLAVARAGKLVGGGDIPPQALDGLRKEWAKIVLTNQRAVAQRFDLRRRVQLEITIQQANWLAARYAETALKPLISVTDGEIAGYLAAHPELDPAAKRRKAEALLQRARAGEEFATLARENTDDPGSKDNGGFYDWFGRGVMVREFENAAFSLQPGQISDLVETQFGYHIIKLEGRQTVKDPETGKDVEQVKVRHILVSTQGPRDPTNPFARPLPVKEHARQEIENGKRDAIIAELVKRSGVIVPADFQVLAPASTPTPAP